MDTPHTVLMWFLVVAIFTIFIIGVVYWKKHQQIGTFHNCLGKKGSWTKTGYNLIEDIFLQGAKAGGTDAPPPGVLKCILQKLEHDYDPVELLSDLTTGNTHLAQYIQSTTKACLSKK